MIPRIKKGKKTRQENLLNFTYIFSFDLLSIKTVWIKVMTVC